MLTLLLWLTAVLTLIYFNTSIPLLIGLHALALTGLGFTTWFAIPTLIAGWIVLLSIAMLTLVPSVRRIFFTKGLFDRWQNLGTQRRKLNINSAWEQSLLQANPDWSALHAEQTTLLSHTEKTFSNETTMQLCAMLDDWEIVNETQHIPAHIWQFIKEKNFFALNIANYYGGHGFSDYATARIVRNLGSRSMTMACYFAHPLGYHPANLLIDHGNTAQKERYLNAIAHSDKIITFAQPLTQNTSIPLIAATLVDERITFQWDFEAVFLAEEADVFIFYVDIKPVGETITEQPSGPSLIMLGREEFDTLPQIQGDQYRPLNMPLPLGRLSGHAEVSLANVIGGFSGIGHGRSWLVQGYQQHADHLYTALSITCSQAASLSSNAFARASGAHKDYQCRQRLAQMNGDNTLLLAGLSLLYAEQKSALTLFNSLHQLLMNLAQQHLEDAMMIQGLKGLCTGPNNVLAPSYLAHTFFHHVQNVNPKQHSRDLWRALRQKNQPILAALSDKKASLPAFDRACLRYVATFFSLLLRGFLSNIFHGHTHSVTAPHAVKPYYQQLKRLSIILSVSADLLDFSASKKKKQHQRQRLIHIYTRMMLISEVLAQARLQGYTTSTQYLLDWTCQQQFALIEHSLKRMLSEWQPRWFGRLFTFWIFPTGRHNKMPNDALTEKMTAAGQEDANLQTQMITDLYLTADEENPLASSYQLLNQQFVANRLANRLAQASHQADWQANKRESQVVEAIGEHILSEQEGEQLLNYWAHEAQLQHLDSFN